MSLDSASTAAGGRGRLLSQLANAMVRLYADSYGRGPTRAKTTWDGGDVLTILLEDVWTRTEQTLVDAGYDEHVCETRRLFQKAKRDDFIGSIETLTGRRVRAFMSSTSIDPPMAVEVFVLESEPATAAGGAASLDGAASTSSS